MADDEESVNIFLKLFVAKRMDQLQAVKNILTLGIIFKHLPTLNFFLKITVLFGIFSVS